MLTDNETIQYVVKLPASIANLLEELAKLQGLSVQDTIKASILVDSFIKEKIFDGCDILVRNKDGSVQRMVLK